MKKFIIFAVLGLMLTGCGNNEVEPQQVEYENRISELEEKISALEEEQVIEVEEPEVESIDREEMAMLVEEYLNNYEFDDRIGEFRVFNEEGKGDKMDFVIIRLFNKDTAFYNDYGFRDDAETVQTLYTEMMYYCNDLLNELLNEFPQYKYNLEVLFSGYKHEISGIYFPDVAHVGYVENKKSTLDRFDYFFKNHFGYSADLVVAEDLE